MVLMWNWIGIIILNERNNNNEHDPLEDSEDVEDFD
jgi:hypothetical protein